MKTRVAAAVAALMLGVVAPASSALAFSYDAPRGHYTGFVPYEPQTTGAIGVFGSRDPAICPMSSAAEGNANQQNFPVKQYGQTAGGNRC
ncbi:hypothetical protein [Methylobacterium radiodurans]|uniref:Uncharacterized protein n=1 Tax=Methylobacterium radiodurans TaxID=2202828 RepID=A0A2U8W1D4_9HYPH|nr:hypothetical protein [Methylobacterium radiodurans]AWN39076.1 hypothetical protein DK427_16970 [Methylobacterium radiodurans]